MGLSLFLRLLWMQYTATERPGFQTVFYYFKMVLKQLKEINKPRPDGGPRTFSIRTALTDRQKLTDLRPAQLGAKPIVCVAPKHLTSEHYEHVTLHSTFLLRLKLYDDDVSFYNSTSWTLATPRTT